MTRDDPHPNAEREDLLTAALRMLHAERTWGTDAVPEDSEYDAREAFDFVARAYVRAIDVLSVEDRPRGWDLNDIESLHAQVAQLTEERNWLRATNDRNSRVIQVWTNHHQKHPLPEGVRKQVVAAMDGTTVDEVRD
jgi:hypothetical protein